MENKWDKLSMRQRADLIRLFVKNGVTSLEDMRQQYNSYDTGGFLDGPDDPPSGNNPNENQPYIKLSPQDVLKSRYKEVTRKLDPIEFLNSYVNSQAFEDRAPSDWYINKARKNVENFDRVHTPSTDNWFQWFITDYHPHQRRNSIYTVDEDYSFALPANNYMRAGIFPKDEIVAHEYGHIIDPKKYRTDLGIGGPEEYLGLSDAYREAFEGVYGNRGHYTKDGTKLNSHDSSQVEKYADLQALRYKLYSKGIYDIRKGEEFNEEHYDKAVRLIKNDRLLDIYNKDEIIRLMNTIADSNMDSEDYFLNYPIT